MKPKEIQTRLILGIIVLLFTSNVFSQFLNLSGRVVSLADNQPIPGAIVKIPGLNLTDTTDLIGRFSFFQNTGVKSKIYNAASSTVQILNQSLSLKIINEGERVDMKVFTLEGKLIKSYATSLNKGSHIFFIKDIPGIKKLDGLGVIRIITNKIDYNFYYNPIIKSLHQCCKTSSDNDQTSTQSLKKQSTNPAELLDVRAWGFKGKEVNIISNTQGNVGDIALGTMDNISIVPIPQEMAQGARNLVLTPQSKIISVNTSLANLIPILMQEIDSITGIKLTSSASISSPGDIELIIDPTFPNEKYHIEIIDRVKIIGGSYNAVVFGTSTLNQLIQASGQIDQITIRDWPKDHHRQLMIDVARKYHSLETMKNIIIMSRLYKINYLQLHLIDDGSYSMFPFQAFPKIHQGQSGDKGPKPPYSLVEWRELINFASDRGITIIPEFEAPGHSGQLIRAYPEIFSLNTAEKTCQNYAKPEARAALKIIISELSAVFTNSPYIHMGGDEARFWSAWETPEFQQSFINLNLPQPYTMQHSLYVMNDFFIDLNTYVKEQGKKLILWEGFQRKYDSLIQVPRDVIVMPFDSWKHTPWELVEDGFDILSATWIPNYIVDTNWGWSPEEIYQWDKFYFEHWYPASLALGGKRVDPQYDNKIIGASMCSWATREEMEIPLIRNRLPAFAEKIWNPESGRTYQDYNIRFIHTDQVLDKLLP